MLFEFRLAWKQAACVLPYRKQAEDHRAGAQARAAVADGRRHWARAAHHRRRDPGLPWLGVEGVRCYNACYLIFIERLLRAGCPL